MRTTDHFTQDFTGKFDQWDHGLFGGCIFCNAPVGVQEDFEVVQSHGRIYVAHCACIEESMEEVGEHDTNSDNRT